ncbi:MAG: signal peptidase I [Elusimicrobia bacterium]|nr:signal peptidase I [Elusimicrobiota bacterium]
MGQLLPVALLLAALAARVRADCPVVAETRTVRGRSMEPLFQSGRSIRLLRGYYACRPARRGDVVVYSFAADRDPIIKTIKAVAGDRFSLRRSPDGGGWNVMINGAAARNSRGVAYALRGARVLASQEKVHRGIVPDNACLLLGEDPGGSFDGSRLGLADAGSLAGKVDGLMLQ